MYTFFVFTFSLLQSFQHFLTVKVFPSSLCRQGVNTDGLQTRFLFFCVFLKKTTRPEAWKNTREKKSSLHMIRCQEMYF